MSEKLRSMLRASGLTDYAIAKRSGLTSTNVGLFLGGKAKLSGESLDRVCDAFGFALVDTRSGRKSRAARPAVANPGEKMETPVDPHGLGCILPTGEGE